MSLNPPKDVRLENMSLTPNTITLEISAALVGAEDIQTEMQALIDAYAKSMGMVAGSVKVWRWLDPQEMRNRYYASAIVVPAVLGVNQELLDAVRCIEGVQRLEDE